VNKFILKKNIKPNFL